MNKTLAKRLVLSAVGPSVTIKWLVSAGIFCGFFIGNSIATNPASPADSVTFFIVPAGFLFCFVRIFSLLRFPRRLEWPFILGLKYTHRVEIALTVLRQTFFELVSFSIPFIAGFAVSFFLLKNQNAISETINTSSILIGELLVLYSMMYVLIRIHFGGPARSDPHRFSIVQINSHGAKLFFAKLFNRISTTPALFLPLDNSVILRRQILYLCRNDFFSLVFFHSAGLSLAVVATILMNSLELRWTGFVCLAIPVFILNEMAEVMAESKNKIDTCSYYNFPENQLLRINSFIALAIVLPYLIIFSVQTFLSAVYLNNINFSVFSSFSASLITFAIVNAHRWSGPNVSRLTGSVNAIAIISAVLGLMIPLYGMVFPVFALAFAVFIMKRSNGP